MTDLWVDLMNGWFCEWLTGEMDDCLMGWFDKCLVDWFDNWLIGLISWLVNVLMNGWWFHLTIDCWVDLITGYNCFIWWPVEWLIRWQIGLTIYCKLDYTYREESFYYSMTSWAQKMLLMRLIKALQYLIVYILLVIGLTIYCDLKLKLYK